MLPDFSRYEKVHSYFARVGRVGGDVRVIGRTLFGREILCLKMGGDRLPPVLITAGAHADEIAGVFAAAKLAAGLAGGLEIGRAIYLVPCRDPLGWDGFSRALELASGRECRVSTHGDAVAALRSSGAIVREEETPVGEMLLAIVGEVAFATIPPVADPHFDFREYLEGMLARDSGLSERLAGRRIMIPNSPPHGARGPYEWGGGTTVCVLPGGEVGNLNRFFDRGDAPVEVRCVGSLAARLRPALTLDLHEGYGGRHYFFAPRLETPLERRVASAMAAALRDKGYEPDGLADLAPYWGPVAAYFHDQGDGMFCMTGTQAGRSSLAAACEPYGPTFVTETGMEGDLERRVGMIETAAGAAIAVMDERENWG